MGFTNSRGKKTGVPLGIVQDPSGELCFAEWNCRARQNNVINGPVFCSSSTWLKSFPSLLSRL